MSKNLTIIIVTFNSSKIISTCLEKINFDQYNCVVVDNASSDNTIQIISQKFSQVKIVRLKKNIGYGRANNVALHNVNTDFALILNPDAFLFDVDVEKMLDLMIKNQSIAISAPLLLNKYPTTQEDKNGQLQIVYGNLIEDKKEYLSVKYLIGAILFLRMQVFKKIGFFDENIFLYYEDDEIVWRAVKNGYEAAIAPSVFGFHIGQGSSGSSLRGIYRRFWHRSLSKFYWKQKRKSSFNAIRSASWLSLMFLIKSFFYMMIFNPKKSVENFASAAGSLAFLIGLKAFNKQGNPRG